MNLEFFEKIISTFYLIFIKCSKINYRVIKSREPWFSAIPGSSSSEEDAVE